MTENKLRELFIERVNLAMDSASPPLSKEFRESLVYALDPIISAASSGGDNDAAKLLPAMNEVVSRFEEKFSHYSTEEQERAITMAEQVMAIMTTRTFSDGYIPRKYQTALANKHVSIATDLQLLVGDVEIHPSIQKQLDYYKSKIENTRAESAGNTIIEVLIDIENESEKAADSLIDIALLDALVKELTATRLIDSNTNLRESFTRQTTGQTNWLGTQQALMVLCSYLLSNSEITSISQFASSRFIIKGKLVTSKQLSNNYGHLLKVYGPNLEKVFKNKRQLSSAVSSVVDCIQNATYAMKAKSQSNN